MKYSLRLLTLAVASTSLLALSGCGGGGGGGGVETSTVTVVPSLGQFTPGTDVQLTNPVNGAVLASGPLGANGSVQLTVSGYSGPIVVEVKGNDTVPGKETKYYDERTGSQQTFATGKSLRAVMSGLRDKVGVTALTNAAVVKLEAAKGGLAAVDATKIDDTNAKVAAAVGLLSASILDAPTLVGKDTPAKSLKVTTPGDKYALILAGLAVGSATNAADAAEAFAKDLKDDDVFDGKDSNGTITNAPTPDSLDRNYRTAATSFADPTENLAIQISTLPTTKDVTKVTGDVTSPVNLAKAMFAELRTTLNSFSNPGTGFLDTQATRMNADLNANVAPELTKVSSRIGTLGTAMAMFEDAKAYPSSNTFGLVVQSNPSQGIDTTLSGLFRKSGSHEGVWNGYGSHDVCWTDSAAGVNSKVSCAHAGYGDADHVNNRIKYVVYVLTSSTANQYSYTATRYNIPVTVNVDGQTALGAATLAASVPAGSGTLSKTSSGTTLTGLTINGTLPPSATNPDGTLATGVDTIAISAVRTALTAANNFHYAMSGSVATTNLADASKVVTLSLDNGSYFDSDETASATGGNKVVAAKLVGTAKTSATKFTGALDVGSFKNNADGFYYSPTSIVFNGSISDTSVGGAGEMLTGKLEAAVPDYNLYHSIQGVPTATVSPVATAVPDYNPYPSTQAQSATNYLKATVTFTGTVQAPSRPALKLVVAATKTGVSTGTVTVDYSYGSVWIRGNGGTSATGNTLTLSNQNGVQVVLNSQSAGTVTKSDTTLATIGNGRINYSDGTYESLN